MASYSFCVTGDSLVQLQTRALEHADRLAPTLGLGGGGVLRIERFDVRDSMGEDAYEADVEIALPNWREDGEVLLYDRAQNGGR